MLVTLLTDGSYCSETKAGGYGYYAISKRGKAHGGGPMRGLMQNSNTAEVAAAINGLHFALKHGIAEPGDQVLIQMDATTAISQLQACFAPSPPGDALLFRPFRDMVLKNNLSVSFRHVKAHTSAAVAAKSPRHYCNNLVDKHAKAGMKEARAQIRGKLPLPTTKAVS